MKKNQLYLIILGVLTVLLLSGYALFKKIEDSIGRAHQKHLEKLARESEDTDRVRMKNAYEAIKHTSPAEFAKWINAACINEYIAIDNKTRSTLLIQAIIHNPRHMKYCVRFLHRKIVMWISQSKFLLIMSTLMAGDHYIG